MNGRTISSRLAGIAVTALLLAGCTGGQETSADEGGAAKPNAATAQAQQVDAVAKLAGISASIPLYPGAAYREDLTRRDQVMIRNQYGSDAQVYTMASDDSFPQVWHYYVTYLAQFRGYSPAPAYPPGKQDWRTLQVHLNQAMQDPFIPGNSLTDVRQNVILQLTETEAQPPTVVRYIVTSRAVALTPQVAQNVQPSAAAAPGESAEAPTEAR